MSGTCNKVGDGTRQLEVEVHWADQSALNNILVELSYWPNTVTYHFSLNVNKCHQYNLVKKRTLNLDLSVNILPLIILIHSDWTQRKGEAVYHEWLTSHTNGPFSCTSYWKHYLPITSLVGGQGQGDPCTVRSNASWVMVTWWPPVNGQTRLKTLPSRNFVGRR